MAGFTVTCASCGREFSPSGERSLYDKANRRYTCSQCLARLNISSAGKKRRTKVGSTLRIVFGALFILTAFSVIGDGDGTWLTCLIIGLALLVWQFWPQLIGLVTQKRTQAAIRQLQEDYRAREAEKQAQERDKPKLCPHCGATTSGFVCEYCGMPLELK